MFNNVGEEYVEDLKVNMPSLNTVIPEDRKRHFYQWLLQGTELDPNPGALTRVDRAHKGGALRLHGRGVGLHHQLRHQVPHGAGRGDVAHCKALVKIYQDSAWIRSSMSDMNFLNC